MDRLLVSSKDMREHLQRLQRALQPQRERQKSVEEHAPLFSRQAIRFLWFRLSVSGVEPYPIKINLCTGGEFFYGSKWSKDDADNTLHLRFTQII